MQEFISRTQNSFLGNVLEIAFNSPGSDWLIGLMNLEQVNGRTSFRRSHEIPRTSEILHFSKKWFSINRLKSFSYSNPTYGPAKEVIFDLPRLERAISFDILPRVCHLLQEAESETFRRFLFRDDKYRRISALEKLCAGIPQKAMERMSLKAFSTSLII